jgi:uncharacterized protein with HEPN domain
MPPRREEFYLRDMLEAADRVERYVAGLTFDELLAHEMARSALLHELATIGEAAAHISPELRAGYPNIDWSDIVAFRNFIVHEYFAIDWMIIWIAATKNAPRLANVLRVLLETEYPFSEE